MKTLFLNPPSFQGFDGGAGSRWQAKREIKSFWYPTWLAQASALVPDSKLVDGIADELTVEDVVKVCAGYDLVIIYTSTPSFSSDTALAARVRQEHPELVIGFVGPHVSVLPEESLLSAPALDFVIRREFEMPVQQIAAGVPHSQVAGVSWRDEDSIRHNPDSDLLTDLDSLPFVVDIYKRDLNIENYYVGYMMHPFISFYSGRGCPARCTYCLWPQTFLGHKYRVRGAESVYQEFARAKELFPAVKEFFIDDDSFTANCGRAEEIAKKLGTLGIVWSTSTRANIGYDTLKVLKENGLRLLMTGYESGSDEILKNVRKGITTDRMRRFTRDCKSLGIALHGCFVIGLPGETPETAEQTARFARELDPDTIQVSIAAPYPGTEFYRQAVENNWIVLDDLVSGDGTQSCPVRYDAMSPKQMSDARDRAYRGFYFRPKVICRIGWQMALDPDVRRRRLREGKEFLSFLRQRNDKAHSPGARNSETRANG